MTTRDAGERTLLISVLLSAPGPLVVGLGLVLGRSSTQLADFVRRSAELVAIVVSWAVYRFLARSAEPDAAQKARLERLASAFVGLALCVSGVAMLIVTLVATRADKGNVIPGLVIALLGVGTNTWLWLRYRRLDRTGPNAILAAQARLYRAKSLVDGCVSTALVAVAVAPHSPAASYLDVGGALVVSAYLVLTGVAALRERVPLV